jgi:hypothetical protein
MRAEKGKGLGDESVQLIDDVQAELAELTNLLAKARTPETEVKNEDLESANKELRAAFMRFMQSNSEGS